MPLVCLDTQITIWAIKEQATPGQEHMIDRARRFLEYLDKKGDRILLPTVVVTELLIHIPYDEHPMFINLINRAFVVAPYDIKATAIYARIWQQRQDADIISELINEGIAKSRIKADCMIAATALAQNANCIYSHDKGLRKFAADHIDVLDLPDVPKQLDLFETS